METMQYPSSFPGLSLSKQEGENPHNGVVQRENMSLHNFLLFHLRSVKSPNPVEGD